MKTRTVILHRNEIDQAIAEYILKEFKGWSGKEFYYGNDEGQLSTVTIKITENTTSFNQFDR